MDAMVAFIITSLVIAALMAAVSQGAATVIRTTDQYRASSYARSKLSEIRGFDRLVVGHSTGELDQEFSYDLSIAISGDLNQNHDAAPLVAYDVELQLSWRRGKHAYHRFYRTVVVRPRGQRTRAAKLTRQPELGG